MFDSEKIRLCSRREHAKGIQMKAVTLPGRRTYLFPVVLLEGKSGEPAKNVVVGVAAEIASFWPVSPRASLGAVASSSTERPSP